MVVGSCLPIAPHPFQGIGRHSMNVGVAAVHCEQKEAGVARVRQVDVLHVVRLLHEGVRDGGVPSGFQVGLHLVEALLVCFAEPARIPSVFAVDSEVLVCFPVVLDEAGVLEVLSECRLSRTGETSNDVQHWPSFSS